MGTEGLVSHKPAAGGTLASRALPALMSQVLVAFTVELDNEFERRMGEAGYPGARLSLGVWANLMRFVAEEALPVRELSAHALAPEAQIKFQLGCLERWGFVVLEPDREDRRPVPQSARRKTGRVVRDGWGSGRGVRADWLVRLTSKGRTAAKIWPPLFGEIERRWEGRFGKRETGRLRQTLQNIADQLNLELPHGLPANWASATEFPPRAKRDHSRLPLPAVLAQVLLTFRLEFDRESAAPLALCANTLRVLSETPVRLAEIPRLTGGSPETSGIGWQIKPYVVVQPDPAASRGKVVRLSLRGLMAQQAYHRLTREIEDRWKARFGGEEIAQLRESLQGLFDPCSGDRPLLSEGLAAPQGTARAGHQAPALGRRDVGAAARQRLRDLVAQTEAFERDPAGTLPHYPLWDMNRGFGP